MRWAGFFLATALLGCGSTTRDPEPRGFRHVEGPEYTLPHGNISIRRYSLGFDLAVWLTKNPEFHRCHRAQFGTCSVTTCTWPPDASPEWNATGQVEVSWGQELESTSTGEDIVWYGLWPDVPWTAGEEISVVAEFDIGPPLEAKLVAPPSLAIAQPHFLKSKWGPDIPLPLELDTGEDFVVQWSPENEATAWAFLGCASPDAGQLTEIGCSQPASAGSLTVPTDVLWYLPTTGCRGWISITARDAKLIELPSWTYRVEAVSVGSSPDGADADGESILK